MYLRSKILTASALTFALVQGGFAQETPDKSTVAATVNGVEITLGHLAIAKNNLPEQYQSLPADVLYDGLLEQLVQHTLLMQSFDGEVPDHVEMTLENNRRQVMANFALETFIASAVTEEALNEAYEEMFADFTPEREWFASHILVETEEEANEILALAQGGDDFAALAREHSTGPSGPNGGELGWFGKGRMVSEFENAVMGMEKGEVTGPVQTQFGFHLIKLNDVRDLTKPPLDEVRDDLTATLGRDLIESYLDQLQNDGDVELTDGIAPEAISDLDFLTK